MAETRQRIAAAAVGAAWNSRASPHDIERSGRPRWRATPYRLSPLPTEADLFGACSAHFFTEHPLPDIEPWRKIGDPHQRLQQALDDLYGYYERTEQMFSNVLRDAELIEDLRPTLAPMQQYLDEVVEILTAGWVPEVEGGI